MGECNGVELAVVDNLVDARHFTDTEGANGDVRGVVGGGVIVGDKEPTTRGVLGDDVVS